MEEETESNVTNIGIVNIDEDDDEDSTTIMAGNNEHSMTDIVNKKVTVVQLA
jgi:hypothetical protein